MFYCYIFEIMNKLGLKAILIFVLFLFWNSIFSQFVRFEQKPQIIDASYVNRPTSIVYYDIDSDGDEDFVLSCELEQSLRYLKNNTGSFTEHVLLDSLLHPNNAKKCDLNNDGNLDLIVSSFRQISILFKINKDSFLIKFLKDSQLNDVNSVKCVDLDGDNLLDIVALTHLRTLWFKNLGNNKFSPSKLLLKNNELGSGVNVETPDLNKDGKKDLVILCRDSLYTIMNYGNDSFAILETLIENSANNIGFLLIKDLNSDGYPDIISKVYSNNKTLKWINNGTSSGTFNNPTTFSSYKHSENILSGDLDGDGKDELLMHSHQKIQILKLNSDGVIWKYKMLPNYLYSISDIKIIDYNGDNLNDILTCSSNDDHIQVHLNRGNDSFESITIYKGVSNNSKVFSADWTNNGIQDLLINKDYSNDVFLYKNRGNGTFNDRELLFTSEFNIDKIKTIDLNNDDKDDLIVTAIEKNKIGMLLNGSSSLQTIFSSSNAMLHSELIDLNKDGFIDILISIPDSNQLIFLKNTGNNSFEKKNQLVSNFNPGDGYFILIDLDEDSLKDIFYVEYSSNSKNYFLKNLGNGLFSLPKYITSGYFLPKNSVVTDANFDGFPDIVGASSKTHTFYSFPNDSFRAETRGLPHFYEIEITDIDKRFARQFFTITDEGFQIFYPYRHDYKKLIEKQSIEPFQDRRLFGKFKLIDVDGDNRRDFVVSLLTKDKLEWYKNITGLPILAGTAYSDINKNGKKDTFEKGLSNILISLNDSIKILTDINGNYRYAVDPGVYNISIEEFNETKWKLSSLSPYEYNKELIDTNGFYNLDFGFESKDTLIELALYSNSSFLRCDNITKVNIGVMNLGNAVTSGYLSLFLDSNIKEYSNFSLAPLSNFENRIVWELMNLHPGKNINVSLDIRVPGVNQGILPGDKLKFNLKTSNNINSDTAMLSLNKIVRCAYDPNDKQVIPFNDTLNNITNVGEDLLYTIRFQNTGNDTAFNIKIKDTINQTLELSSFSLLGSSHQDNLEIQFNNNVITFYFKNINLPDSNIDYENSQGFVTFKIDQKKGLNIGTKVINGASIYFDLNPPIHTNKTLNTIGRKIILDESEIIVYPNPANNSFKLRIGENFLTPQLAIYNSLGIKVLELNTISEKSIEISSKNWKQGTYLISIIDKNTNQSSTTKLLILNPN